MLLIIPLVFLLKRPGKIDAPPPMH